MAEPDVDRRDRLRAWLVLLAITLAGAWARGAGLDVLLPCRLEPDAVYVDQALELREARAGRTAAADELPPFYPLLLPWLLSWLPLDPAAPPQEAPLADHLRAASAPHLWGRRLVALISIGLAPATYALARAVLSRGAALLAAAFAAASLTHLTYSAQARPHAAFAVLCAAGLAAALYLRRSGTHAAHLAAGVACALALACLHTGVFLVPALAVAAFTARERGAGKALLAFAPLAVCLPVAYPELVSSTRLEEGGVIGSMGHAFSLELFHGRGFVLAPRLAFWFEPVVTLLAAAALAVAAARALARRPIVAAEKRADWLAIAAFAAPFALAVGAIDRPWERYWLPLVPAACLLAAAAAARLAGTLRLSRAARLAGALALLALPALACARVALARQRPDSTERAAAWIEAQLERARDDVLTSAYLSLPLVRRPPEPDPVPDWGLSPWDLHQRRHPELAARADAWDLRHLWVRSRGPNVGRAVLELDVLLAALREAGDAWLVVERIDWAGNPDRTRAAAQAAGAELVASFEPDAQAFDFDGRGEPIGYRATWNALTARFAGPRLEIWSLRGDR